MASRVGPAPTPSWRVTSAPAGLPDSCPRGGGRPAVPGRGASPDKGRLELGAARPPAGGPARVRQEQPTGTNSPKGWRPEPTAPRGSSRPARRPPWRGHDPPLGPCRHTWRGLASTQGSGSRSAWRRGPCHPLATAGGGRATAGASAQARRL